MHDRGLYLTEVHIMSVMRSMLTIQVSGEVKQNMKRLQSRFLRLGGLFRLVMMYIERSVQ